MGIVFRVFIASSKQRPGGAERRPGGGTLPGVRIIHDDGFLEIADFMIVLCGDDLEYCEEVAPHKLTTMRSWRAQEACRPGCDELPESLVDLERARHANLWAALGKPVIEHIDRLEVCNVQP